MGRDFSIITNNPLVLEKLAAKEYQADKPAAKEYQADKPANADISDKNGHNIVYKEVSYEGLLKEVRGRIHQGYVLLTHPLSGSVKPNETPYKSVLVSNRKGTMEEQEWSIKLIENAIASCGKFQMKADRFPPEVLKDFQLIDWTLLESALASAEE